jgi:hypothetical protein
MPASSKALGLAATSSPSSDIPSWHLLVHKSLASFGCRLRIVGLDNFPVALCKRAELKALLRAQEARFDICFAAGWAIHADQPALVAGDRATVHSKAAAFPAAVRLYRFILEILSRRILDVIKLSR